MLISVTLSLRLSAAAYKLYSSFYVFASLVARRTRGAAIRHRKMNGPVRNM